MPPRVKPVTVANSGGGMESFTEAVAGLARLARNILVKYCSPTYPQELRVIIRRLVPWP